MDKHEHWLAKHLNKLDEGCKFLECDGLSKVISMILFESGLHHQIQCGTIQTSYGKHLTSGYL